MESSGKAISFTLGNSAHLRCCQGVGATDARRRIDGVLWQPDEEGCE